MRLDRWFKAHFPDLAFGHLQKLLRSGQVRVDGGRVKTSTRLEPGQAVRVPPLGGNGRPASEREAGPRQAAWIGSLPVAIPCGRPHRRPLPARGRTGRAARTSAMATRCAPCCSTRTIRSLSSTSRPGLAVQGGSGLTRHVDGMLEALVDRKGQKPRLVHRLDRDTSGVLVVARTRLAAQKLAESFRHRSTRKIYWALVKGVPKPHQGRISTWLAKEGTADGDRMRVARHGADDASHAVTHYSVVETAGQQLAWLSMRPVTGRTHQLRAHAAHIGHPIVGDPKYFNIDDWQLPGGMQNKLHLHARRIVMPHPAGGTLDVTAPLPPHMQQSWNLLGFDLEAGARQSEQEED